MCFNFRNCQTVFQNVCARICIPANNCSASLPDNFLGHSGRHAVTPCVFICICLMSNDVDSLAVCLSAIPISLVKRLFQCFPIFKKLSYSVSAATKVASVMSDSVQPHGRQPTRLPHPWDSPGKNTGVGCQFLLRCMKVRSESEVAQSCLTLCDPMDCSLPGSSVHGIFQARVLEWGYIA